MDRLVLGFFRPLYVGAHRRDLDRWLVAVPDDVIAGAPGALKQMVEAHHNIGGHMVATMDVPRAATGAYGVLDVASESGRIAHARGMVEKPRPDVAPSTKAVVGRYILEASIFDRLDAIGPGAGGELQLTDAINEQAAAGAPVHGYRFQGKRFDCGSKSGFLEATVAFALDRPDLGPEFGRYLRALVEKSKVLSRA